MRYKVLAGMVCLLALVTADATAIMQLKSHTKEGILVEYQDPYAVIGKEMTYFPVAESMQDTKKTIHYYDSFLGERTYKAARVHEGCDIMADYNHRGVYPIVSVCDGVIDKIGWLELGGYRIGIRSASGVYYYYAHLSDYSKDYAIGDTVSAGEVIGFMGDSGYGKTEGTVGKFDVHLHFGIYLTDENGKEYAINPYPMLKQTESQKRGAVF